MEVLNKKVSLNPNDANLYYNRSLVHKKLADEAEKSDNHKEEALGWLKETQKDIKQSLEIKPYEKDVRIYEGTIEMAYFKLISKGTEEEQFKVNTEESSTIDGQNEEVGLIDVTVTIDEWGQWNFHRLRESECKTQDAKKVKYLIVNKNKVLEPEADNYMRPPPLSPRKKPNTSSSLPP